MNVSRAGTVRAPGPARWRRRAAPLPALLLPLAYVGWIGPAWVEPRTDAVTAALAGMAILWGCAGATWLLVGRTRWSPASPLHVRPPTVRTVLLALGTGLLLALLVPLLTLVAAWLLPASSGAGVPDVAAAHPAWLLAAGVATAAGTEEVLFRAYAVEILGGRRPRLGAAVGLLAFVALHAGGWSAAHVVGVVAPAGILLALAYLWRRDLVFVVLVHAVVDAPLVVLALLG